MNIRGIIGCVNYFGNLKIYYAEVNSPNTRCLYQSGIGRMEVFDGRYSGQTGVGITAGNIMIYGGTISGSSYAINIAVDDCSITIGDISKINNNNIVIKSNSVGIRATAGTIGFNCGIVKVPMNKTLISGNVDIPLGYHISNGTDTIDGQEYITAYIEKD